MARISVVVPIYEVERYLEECLASVAAQTFADLEVVMVDDGSTDSSAEIAERFTRDDRRFRLLRQPNAGLSAARNTGIDAAGGEYLAFLDSDDVLPADAYERLLGALERTGSDFATGNVQRLTAAGCVQAPFLARTFARTRLRTHVRRFPPLLADRTAWNKLWRRAFWDDHALRFPEGRLHEDIPVVLPAHFRASSVDVLSTPVYRYRLREDGGPSSITQRRHELRALRDRLAAIEHVYAHVREHESAKHVRRYERSVVAGDLRYHLDLLGDVDDEYRAVFLAAATAFLDRAGPRVCERLPAIERLKWHLVARRLLPELLEVLRFQREDALRTPPVRVRGRYYGDFPFRGDPRLGIPRSVFRLGRRDQELALSAHLEDLRFEDGKLRLSGHAYVNALGAPAAASQRVALGAVAPGRWRALRLRCAALRLPTAPTRRPDLDPGLDWSGFRASLAPHALGHRDGRWEVFAYVRAGGLRRRRARFVVGAAASAAHVLDGTLVRVTTTADGAVRLDARTQWLYIDRQRVAAGALELAGSARLPHGATLELAGADTRLAFPLEVTGSRIRVRVPLADLLDGEWELTAGGHPVVLGERSAGALLRAGARETQLARTPAGGARLLALTVDRAPVQAPAAMQRIS